MTVKKAPGRAAEEKDRATEEAHRYKAELGLRN